MSRILWAASISPIGHWISSSQTSLRLRLSNNHIALPLAAKHSWPGYDFNHQYAGVAARSRLLCLQRRDRRPIRTRRRLFEGPPAFKKQGRRLVKIGAALKTLYCWL